MWIVETNPARVRVVDAGGVIQTAASGLQQPIGVAIATDGKVYVADTGNHRVVSVLANGKVTVIAGDSAHPAFHGDGGPARRAYLFEPYDVAVDDAGDLFIADTGNSRVREVDAATGKIRTVAGDGAAEFGGDGGQATDAHLQRPESIAVDGAGTTLYIADTRNDRIRQVDLATGVITTIGGNGAFSGPFVPGATGLDTPMNHLNTIALDAEGNLYMVVDYTEFGNVIMQMSPDGGMTRVAGGGSSQDAGVAALDLSLPQVTALAIEPSTGALLMASNEGVVYRIAGITTPGAP